MCGICGVVDFSGTEPGESVAKAMVARLSHRGPDHEGIWSRGVAAFGHARLSIIDLSSLGNQPMSTADGRFTIAYNGEVYNHHALRRALEASGDRFVSQTDTEVVLQAFSRWGVDCFKRLNGIFAFSIWDQELKQLHLVRDRFGVKPLYFRQDGGLSICFGSEVKAILAAGKRDSDLDWQALHEFMHYGVGGLGARTLFAEVRRLEAGQYLKFSRSGGCQITQYWRIGESLSGDGVSAEPAKRVRFLIEAAIQRQMMSDVPIGVFLSGGIDSSAITAFAAKHYGRGLKSYAVGFDFAEGTNELPKAAAVARHFGTEHHELFIKGTDLPQIIEAMVDCHDDAFSDAANIPLYLLCREVHRTVKVVLQGDGGDEVFGGYRRYSLLAHERLMQAFATGGAIADWLPFGNHRRRRIRRMVDIWRERDPSIRMALLMAQDERQPSPLRVLGVSARRLAAIRDPFERYREIGGRLADADPVQSMLWTDMQILLPDIFLEKVDKATMAWGVEARVPFLDHELTDYVLTLPSATKLPHGRPKGLLKEALRGVVPDFVLDAPKMGFAVPYGRWLRGPLAEFAREKICRGRAADCELLDRQQTILLLEDHIAGRDDHGFLLWKCLNLAIWFERFHPRLRGIEP